MPYAFRDQSSDRCQALCSQLQHLYRRTDTCNHTQQIYPKERRLRWEEVRERKFEGFLIKSARRGTGKEESLHFFLSFFFFPFVFSAYKIVSGCFFFSWRNCCCSGVSFDSSNGFFEADAAEYFANGLGFALTITNKVVIQEFSENYSDHTRKAMISLRDSLVMWCASRMRDSSEVLTKRSFSLFLLILLEMAHQRFRFPPNTFLIGKGEHKSLFSFYLIVIFSMGSCLKVTIF